MTAEIAPFIGYSDTIIFLLCIGVCGTIRHVGLIIIRVVPRFWGRPFHMQVPEVAAAVSL